MSTSTKVNFVNPNEFILTSYYVDSTTGQQGLDLKLINNQGLVLKRKRHMFSTIDFLSFLNNKMQTDISNSTMLITGGASSTVIFASVNKSTLDTNWAKYYYDGIYNYYLNNVFKVKPNEVWFMGGRGNNNGYDERPVVIKTDTMGNILAIKEFTAFIKYTARNIVFDPNNNLLYLAGNNYNNQQTPGFAACIDTMGNVIWNQQNLGGWSFFQVEKKNNYLVLSGARNATNQKLALLKLSSITGSVVWQKTYLDEWPANTLAGFVINSDESIVSVGSYMNPELNVGSNFNGIILKVNSNGDSLWLKSYSNYLGDVEEEFIDVQKSSDGGYLMCGAPFFSQNSQSWVVKTDSLGNGPGVVTATITALHELADDNCFSIYPNPAKEKITISYSNQTLLDEQAYNFVIYNATGQIVKEEVLSFKNKTADIKTSELEEGVYFIKFYNTSAQALYTHKLVIVK